MATKESKPFDFRLLLPALDGTAFQGDASLCGLLALLRARQTLRKLRKMND